MRRLEVLPVKAVREIGGFPLAGLSAAAPYEQVMASVEKGHVLALACYINGQFVIRDVEDGDRYAALQAAFRADDPSYQIHWMSWWSIPADSEAWMPPPPLRIMGEE